MIVSQPQTATVSRAETTTMRPYFCTTKGCRMQDRPIGWSNGTRSRFYCGECRRYVDFTSD